MVVLLFQTQLLWSQAIPTEDDIFALAESAYHGDRSAIRELFGLYQVADGAVFEDIDVVLGNVARSYPQLFLEELKATRTNRTCSNISNTGEELGDRPKEQLQELQLRVNALKSVSEESLKELRNSCLKQLESSVQILVQVLQMEKK